MDTNQTKLITNIERAFSSNTFPNYIEYIRFPLYKNLKNNAILKFDFPFTVLTGLNGSGKSSALHAIYGMPEGQSTSEFWFSTEVDPITDVEGNRNCYIYGYKDASGNILEVLKARTGQSKGLDYWETARPQKRYDMITKKGGGRNKAIKKKVVYIDFREALSAFDKFFYFGTFSPGSVLKSKQDVLRKYSKYLKSALDTGGIEKVRTRRNKKRKALSKDEIKYVSKILGKSYLDCKVIVHNFYGVEGDTVYFKTSSLGYSEAYAGRGEYAVVKLVSELIKAEDGSLVILDEPEVSLHPGAQKELKVFLLEMLLKKKLQIVVSTHSPIMVENLPNSSLKLFFHDSAGKFDIKGDISYLEAFEHIGVDIPSTKKIIIVEDVTAMLLVNGVIKSLGKEYELSFEVKYYPGGAGELFKKAAVYSEEKENLKFILLDGDQKRAVPDFKNMSVADSENFIKLDEHISEITGVKFNTLGFRLDGGSAGSDIKQKIKKAQEYIKYLESNLDYLPGLIPEDLIFDDDYIKQQVGEEIQYKGTDSKQKIMEFTQKYFTDVEEDSFSAAKKLLINNFINKKDSNYDVIAAVLKRFKT